MKDIKQRKVKLQAEIRQFERRFESSLRGFTDKLESFIPTNNIRRSPVFSMILALVAGFLSGLAGPGSRKGGNRRRGAGLKGYFRSGVTFLLTSELKRVAARKALRYLLTMADSYLRGHPTARSSGESRKSGSV